MLMRNTISAVSLTALFFAGLCGNLHAASRSIGELAGTSEVAEAAVEEPGVELSGGGIGVYYQHSDYRKDHYTEDGEIVDIDDGDVVVPFFQAEYISQQYAGFQAGAGLTGFYHLQNNSESHRDASDYDKLVLHKLYLQYIVSETTLTVGRQVLDNSLLLSEYYEAVALTSDEISNLSVLLALVKRFADSDVNNYVEFHDANAEDDEAGDLLFASELSWEAVPETAEATLYYYKQKDLFDLYGGHIELSIETGDIGYGIEADYFATDEDGTNGLRDDDGNVRDSSVYHISPLVEAGDVTFAVGYIQADREVGARGSDLLDDYFNPLNEGDKIYEPDAKTWYGTISYETEDLEAGLMYGTTRYLDGSEHLRETEYGLKAEWEFVEDWLLATEFSVIKSDAPEGDFNLLEMVLRYEF